MTRTTIEKITARIFCQLSGGGNPVTIFRARANSLPQAVQVQLAQSCSWESVILTTATTGPKAEGGGGGKSPPPPPALNYYMPTGEEVNFCAHAAMGGLFQAYQHRLEESLPFVNAMASPPHQQQKQPQHNDQPRATVHEGNVVSLHLQERWEETKLDHPPALARLLRDACGLESSALVQTPHGGTKNYPTFVNFSTARPKTLVYVNSLAALQACRAPTNPAAFARACDALHTTGLYLYTPSTRDDNERSEGAALDSSWECRQFPRASNYPEDPATGIAAAALAVALWQSGIQRHGAYQISQGTAMGHPSRIRVENLVFDTGGGSDNTTPQPQHVSYRLLGRVQVDEKEEMEVEI
jgi:predicted PhzF superfamily epimerase YddE/YHI9